MSDLLPCVDTMPHPAMVFLRCSIHMCITKRSKTCHLDFAKVVNVHFIVSIQSLLVLSWWCALGSVTFLVVSNFNSVITENSSSNSESIFLHFASCVTEPCVSCLLDAEQVVRTYLDSSLLKCVADMC